MGFLDWGYANGATGIRILDVSTAADDAHIVAATAAGANTYHATAQNIKNALHDLTKGYAQDTTLTSETAGYLTNYPSSTTNGLVRGLYYLTEGTPTSVVHDYINYAMTPTAATNDIDPAGMFGITEFS